MTRERPEGAKKEQRRQAEVRGPPRTTRFQQLPFPVLHLAGLREQRGLVTSLEAVSALLPSHLTRFTDADAETHSW